MRHIDEEVNMQFGTSSFAFTSIPTKNVGRHFDMYFDVFLMYFDMYPLCIQ